MTRLLLAAALAATAAGLVHVFRNRLFAGLMPRLVAELRQRFGDAADVRAATLDEHWNLQLEGVRLPLPRGLLIEIESATVAGILRLSLPGGLAGLRVREARGLVCLVGDDLPFSALALPFVYRLDPGETHHAIQGQVEVREGTWAHRRDDRPGTPYLNIDLHLTAGLEGWTADHGRVLAGDAVIELEGHGPPTGAWNARARFMGMSAPLVEHLVALYDPGSEWTPPAEISITGLCEKVANGPLRFHAEASTPGSSVAVDAHRSVDGELSGKLTGKLGLAEVVAQGLFSGGPAPLPNGEVMLDAALGGTVGQPTLSGTAFVAALEIAAGPPTGHPIYRFFDVSAPFKLSRDTLEITGLAAGTVSGRLLATSTVEFGIWPIQHDSQVRWEGVRVEELPTGPSGEHALDALLRAVTTGRAHVVGQGGDLDLLIADGEVTLEEPDFLFLRRLEPTLAGYGLPLPPTLSTAPCQAKLAVSGGALDLTEIRGALQGLSFTGEVRARFDCALSGRLLLTLAPGFLAESPLRGAGAGLGPVDVPVTLGGTLAAPAVSVDVAKAVGGLLRGKGVTGVVGAIGNIMQAARPEDPAPQGADMDRMLGAILEGGAEADRLMDRLIATGISPDEVRNLLADYHRRHGT